MHLKEDSYAHQGCISKYKTNIVKYKNKKTNVINDFYFNIF